MLLRKYQEAGAYNLKFYFSMDSISIPASGNAHDYLTNKSFSQVKLEKVELVKYHNFQSVVEKKVVFWWTPCIFSRRAFMIEHR